MQDNSFIKIICFSLLVIPYSCVNDDKNDHQWTQEEANHFLGKTEINLLMASYHEGDIYTLIVADDNTKKTARLLRYRPDYPTFIDSPHSVCRM